MDDFRTTAFYLTVWHAFLTALVSTLVIAFNDFEPATAFLTAANIALLFSLWLVTRAALLNDARITRGTFWRTVPAKHRPAGTAGLKVARTVLEETWLRFAKGAAAAAIILCGLAYLNHAPDSLAVAKAALTPSSAYAMPIAQ